MTEKSFKDQLVELKKAAGLPETAPGKKPVATSEAKKTMKSFVAEVKGTDDGYTEWKCKVDVHGEKHDAHGTAETVKDAYDSMFEWMKSVGYDPSN
jgi:hypothetical protein